MAGSTLSEKIIAAHAGRDEVSPGELVTCKVDRVMATDITAPHAIAVFRDMRAKRVFDPDACILVNDHFVPARDIRAADYARSMREFAAEQGIRRYFEVGRSGICHVLVIEKCLVLPGQILVGADSHTCTAGVLGAFAVGVGSTDLAAVWALGEIWFKVPHSIRVEFTGIPGPYVEGKDLALALLGRLGVDGGHYRALEFHGEALKNLHMSDRLTICNLAVESGAKTGIMAPDGKTLDYIRERGGDPAEPVAPDPDARYEDTVTIDVSGLEPQVAKPFLPSNVEPVGSVRGERVEQVFIGSCTNGSLEDLRRAARILSGRQVAKGVRCIITPGSQRVFADAVKEGIVSTLIEAGAAVTTPTCGACLGGHSGVLGRDETAVSTSSRNFRGRMGHNSSRVFLANPSVAAATAVAGCIVHPEEVL